MACLISQRTWLLSAGSHARYERIHKPLASLANLYCVESHNLAGEAVGHLYKGGLWKEKGGDDLQQAGE
jgi:hypothetical protein